MGEIPRVKKINLNLFRFLSGGKHSNPTGGEIMMGENKLYCEEAPEPNDVDWEFVHISTK